MFLMEAIMARTKSKKKIRASTRNKRNHRVKRAAKKALKAVSKTVPVPTPPKIKPSLLKEEVDELRLRFGLSKNTRLVLYQNMPFTTIGALVEKLRNGQKIRGIGPARMQEIKDSLARAGVTI
jgi:hypothetical protein